MLQLPNNCYSSTPSIYPTGWKTGGARLLKKNWYVQYWFHDPLFKERYPKGKLCIIKGGVNHFKTLSERRHVIQQILEDEIKALKAGYNPITGAQPNPIEEPIDYEVHPNTPLSEAIKLAAEKVEVAKSTAKDLRSVLRYFIPAAERLRLDSTPISTVRRRHIRMILDEISKSKGGFSPTTYNWYRGTLSILFRQLVEIEAIESNPVRELAKKKGIQKLRQVLTLEERIKIDQHLKEHHYHY